MTGPLPSQQKEGGATWSLRGPLEQVVSWAKALTAIGALAIAACFAQSVAAGNTCPAAVISDQGDPDYGAYLAGECRACHSADGGAVNIIGWPVQDFADALQAYQCGTRQSPVMQMVSGRLGPDEIAALAIYFRDLE